MKNIITKISLLVVLQVLSLQVKLSAQAGVGPAPYCMPTYWNVPCSQPNGSNNTSNWINDFINGFFTTGGVNNITNTNSGCTTQTFGGVQQNYFYYGCPMYLGVNPGQTIGVNFQSGITFAQGFAVFVDWNLDGVFQVPAERVYGTPVVPTANTWYAGSFVVPAGQANGTYRMRVRCSYYTVGTSIDPCNQQSYGETEDYNLVVGPPAMGVITATATANSPVCVGQPLNLSVAYSGTAVPTFTWSGPLGYNSNLQNPTTSPTSSLSSGNYTVLVKGTCNTATAVVNVTVNPTPLITASSSPTAICIGNSATLTANGGATYTWNPGGTNGSPITVSPASTTVYTVTSKSAAGCTGTRTLQVVVNPLPTPTASNNSPVCENGTLNLTSGAATSYTWTGPAGFTSNLQNPSITNVQLTAAGPYSVTVSSAAGCTATAVTNVTINPLPAITAAASPTGICIGDISTLTAGGGTTYTWQPINVVAQTATTSPLASTVYTVTGMDANSCVNTATVLVFINYSPNLTVTATPAVICYGQSSTLNCNGAASYTWIPGNMQMQSPVVTPTATQAYTVFGVSVAGCLSSNTTTVTVNPLPVVNPTNNGPICAGNTLMLTVAGAATYTWTGPNSFSSNAQNPTIPGSQTVNTGVYNVTVATAAGCVDYGTTSAVVNPLPNPVALSNSPVCANQPINFTGSSATAVTYTWTGPGLSSNVQSPSIGSSSAANNGVFTFSVTDANGCVNFTTTAVTVNPLPIPVVNSPTACANGSFTLTASGGNTYTWSGPLGFASSQQNPVLTNAQVSMSGPYNVLVTSAQGCTSTAVANASVTPNPVPSASTGGPVCTGATLQLNASGGTSYAWIGPGSYVSFSQNPSIGNAQVNQSGVYTVVVSANSCTAMTTVNAVVNPLPSPTITSNAPVCAGQQLNITGSGGVLYSWTGPASFSSNSSAPSIISTSASNTGNYNLTVTDANGCVNSTSAFLTVNALPVVSAFGSTVCANQTANLSANGGSTYSWSGPGGFTSNQQNPSLLNSTSAMSGVYSVIVTDVNNCVNTAAANLVINPIPTPQASNNSPICMNQLLGLTASGGQTYMWNGPGGFSSSAQSPTFTANSAALSGNYVVTVTDNIGCSATATTVVQVNPLPTASILSSNSKGCAPLCPTFTAQGSAGVQSYNWNFGSGQSSGGINTTNCYANSGDYTVSLTVADNAGCQGSALFIVNVYPVPVADFNYAPLKPIVNGDGVDFTDASHGANITSWNWYFTNQATAGASSTQQNPHFYYEEPGTYPAVLIVKSDLGCTDTLIKAIFVGEDFGVYVPNSFTPNGDGVNDIFHPKGYGITKYEFDIFDRWGERVYHTNTFEEGWDGKHQTKGGDVLKGDTYIWRIKLTNTFGKAHEYTGHVTLIK
jgi:gliding motility-associated-like protein